MVTQFIEFASFEVQIDDRLSKIETEGYFGDYKSVDEGVFELKWKNSRRIYFSYIPEKKILLLLRGNKNAQSKDIQKAKNLYKKYTTS